jgi:hypothetical protein
MEPIHIGGRELDGHWWLAILIPILIAAAVYVVFMYVRDGRSIGWVWGAFLAALRISVYAILTILFLMPAMQVLDESITRFKVLVLFDVSGSMNNKDDLPTEAVPADKILSRQDKIIRFLNDEQIGFLKRLSKNPTALYRLGAAIDAAAKTRDEGGEPVPMTELTAWLKPDAKPPVIPESATTQEKDDARKQYDLQVMLLNGTNVPDSVLTVLKKESSNQPQGLIVFSDGRSTQFSEQSVNEVRKSRIPVFTVGVGEYREPVRITMSQLAVPPQIQPDMPFKIQAEVDGEGKSEEETTITLQVFKPLGEGKDEEEGKEDPNRKPDMELVEKVKFRPGDPPHASVDFPFDPAKLPAEFRSPDASKPEMLEGKWMFRAVVPKDKREIFEGKEHRSRPAYVRVLKKPLRVLLFAGGPTRDYQFARSLLVRESDQNKRAELSIYIQNARPEVVQDVPEERMLKDFPDHISDIDDPNEKSEEKYLNFMQYDVIVAFDPDWTKLTPQQLTNLERWVDKFRGGLIFVGGPINTTRMAKQETAEHLKPVLDLLPVVLDRGVQHMDRSTAEPWRLRFSGATAEMEFLKLDEESPDKEVLAGWEEFFVGKHDGGREVALRRGFYDYTPVRDVKTSATVVATFSDPRSRLGDGKEQPYLVVMPFGSGQHNVVWIGSGEIWRLRQYREAFHERFWIKLLRYAAAGSQTGQKTRGYIAQKVDSPANKPLKLTAWIYGKDLNPLAQSEKPKMVFKALHAEGIKPVTVDMKANPVAPGDTWEGQFIGQVQLPVGQYLAEIAIPGTTDKLSEKFNIVETNAEMDNPRPDFVELRRLASASRDMLDRVPEELRTKLEPELQRMNRPYVKEGDTDQRLFFDLSSATLIPDCMTRKPLPQISRGPVRDLWDWGFEAFGLPKISVALLVIVGLFSVEWLTRKLLKLA